MIIINPNNKSHVSSSLSGSFSGSFTGAVRNYVSSAYLTGSFAGNYLNTGTISTPKAFGSFTGNFTGAGKEVTGVFDRIRHNGGTEPIKEAGILSINPLGASGIYMNAIEISNTITPLIALIDIPNSSLASSTISGRPLGDNFRDLSTVTYDYGGLEINNQASNPAYLETQYPGVAGASMPYNGSAARYVHWNAINLESNATVNKSDDYLLVYDPALDSQTTNTVGRFPVMLTANAGATISFMRSIVDQSSLKVNYTGTPFISLTNELTQYTGVYAQTSYNEMNFGAASGDRHVKIDDNNIIFYDDNGTVKQFEIKSTNICEIFKPISTSTPGSFDIKNIGTLDQVNDNLVQFDRIGGAWDGLRAAGAAPSYQTPVIEASKIRGIPQVIYGEWNTVLASGNAVPFGNGSTAGIIVMPFNGKFLSFTLGYRANGAGGSNENLMVVWLNEVAPGYVWQEDLTSQTGGDVSYIINDVASSNMPYTFSAGDRFSFRIGNISVGNMNVNTGIPAYFAAWFIFE